MKTLSLLLASTLLLPLAACATGVSDGELLEDAGPDAEKDDGSRQLLIRDKVDWDGQAKQTTKVFTNAAAFEAFSGARLPRGRLERRVGRLLRRRVTRSTGGYEANVLKVTLSASAKTITVSNETVTPGMSCAVTRPSRRRRPLVTIKKAARDHAVSARATRTSRSRAKPCAMRTLRRSSSTAARCVPDERRRRAVTPVAFEARGGETLTKERMLQR